MPSVAVTPEAIEAGHAPCLGAELVADRYQFVVGIDTHARHHVLAIVTAAGRPGSTEKFPTTGAGLARARTWIEHHTDERTDQVLISMEGTGSYGAVFAELLADAGYRVVEAPTPRRGTEGKSDPLDAQLAAHTTMVMALDRLRDRRADEVGQALQILSTSRDQLTGQRTAAVNQLTALLRSHALDEDARGKIKTGQIRRIATWRTRHEPLVTRTARARAVQLAHTIVDLDTDIATNQRQIKELITHAAPELLALPGVGPICAAIVLTAWSQPGRIRSEAAFAKLAGTCPIPASSGNTTRHRLNRFGDRRLNSATHMIAINRLRIDPETRAYRDRRLNENKTKAEIRRCLKRYITRQLYRTLQHHHRLDAL